MGQYYHVITEDKNGKRECYNIQNLKWLESKKNGKPDYHFYNGLKLMEHSWWRNGFCNAFASTLVDNPKRVCWVGDYAEPKECEALGFKYDEVWHRNEKDYIFVNEEANEFKMEDVKYLVNNSKKVYVDLKDYYKKSKINDGAHEWCVFPISLLTALGNGRGGGDFREENSDVGSWAFDEIYLTNNLPDGLEKEEVSFIEQ